jgi:translation initiation factor 2 subunit 1
MAFPDESEIVLCTVSRVHFHSVFVSLDEYGKRQGMLHISEVAPGRIRNIKDYVKDGKVIVCKVLKVDEKRGHIDVSLRRVSEAQRREKLDSLKQQQKAEKIIDFVAKEAKLKVEKLHADITKATSSFDTLYDAFNAVVAGELNIEDLALGVKATKLLDETIRQRITPPEVEIKAKISCECHESNGVEIIKDVLVKAGKVDTEHVTLHYLGAGAFALIIQGSEWEEVEANFGKIEKILDSATSCKIEIARV